MTKRTSLFTWLAITASILSIPAAAAAKTVYVDADAAGANDGTSWEDAYTYLQDALADANDGDEIRVAQGVYRPDQGEGIIPGDRGAIFALKSGVTTSGGYAGYGSPDPNVRDINRYKTILSGDLAGNDVAVADPCDLLAEPSRSENSEHILTVGGATPVLDGFTVTSANCTYSGGGIVMGEADLVVTDCVFTANSAGYCGGAMTGWNSRVVFERCQFIGNAAAGNGGAVFMDTCTCRDGYLACVDCKFINNSAGQNGGAIHIADSTYMLTSLMNCLITGNKAGSHGAALNAYSADGSWLVNCTLSGNWAKSEGPCPYQYGGASLINCILRYNQGSTICPAPSYLYTFTEGASGEPYFVSPGYWDADELWVDGDYHLQPASPCINAGDPEFISEPADPVIPVPGEDYIRDPEPYIIRSSDRDLDGRARIVNGRVDMGPYEYYEYEPPALVAHWKLDEASGNTAYDSAGDNHGILYGNPQWQPDAGRVGGTLSFDGSGDYVNCGNSPTFDITAQMTVAAWVRINAVNMEWQTVIAKGDSAWRLSTARDEYRYCFAVTGGPPWNYISGDTVVAANEWHHVCGTYDGEDLRLYIDGAEDPAGPVPEAAGVTTDEYDVLIGENQERPGRYWDGMIDDVRIYNYALPALEVAQLAGEAPFYVDDNAAGDPAPGDPSASDPLEDGSRAHPFDSIQEAVNAADNGATIIVLDGAYTGDGNREIDFEGKAITLRSQNGPDNCIIDCQAIWASGYFHRGFYFHSGETTDSVVDGFTITRGMGSCGPGINCDNDASPTITNCIITGNMGTYGGGIFGCNGPITNCTITNNWVYHTGGGLSQCDGIISDCVISNNTAGRNSGGGGGLHFCNGTIRNCIISGNRAIDYSSGGGLGLCGGTIHNCIIVGNKAAGDGGGLFGCDGTIINSTVSDNIAGSAGGGIRAYYGTGQITNCIVWENSLDQINGVAAVTYSNIQGGWSDTGNISANPYFAGPGHWDPNGTPQDADDDFWVDGDYHLKSQAGRWDPNGPSWAIDEVTSPCIDAGDPMSPIGNEPFPNGGVINMGAYGGISEASKSYFGKPPCETIVAGDINGDCEVNFRDFWIMALHWMEGHD